MRACVGVALTGGVGSGGVRGILYLNSTRSYSSFENHHDPLTGCK